MTVQITPELLREIGHIMYGDRWKRGLSTDLNVNERTIRRWAGGEMPIPEALAEEVRQLLETQAEAIASAREKLRAIS